MEHEGNKVQAEGMPYRKGWVGEKRGKKWGKIKPGEMASVRNTRGLSLQT